MNYGKRRSSFTAAVAAYHHSTADTHHAYAYTSGTAIQNSAHDRPERRPSEPGCPVPLSQWATSSLPQPKPEPPRPPKPKPKPSRPGFMRRRTVESSILSCPANNTLSDPVMITAHQTRRGSVDLELGNPPSPSPRRGSFDLHIRRHPTPPLRIKHRGARFFTSIFTYWHRFEFQRKRIKERCRTRCGRFFTNIYRRWTLTKIQRKIQDPKNCSAIHYRCRKRYSHYPFVRNIFLLTIWTWLTMLLHQGGPGWIEDFVGDFNLSDQDDPVLLWSVTEFAPIGILGAAFFLAQSVAAGRNIRAKMVAVNGYIMSIAEPLVKAGFVETESYDRYQLQQITYECLALLTAYNVCLTHQMLGHAYEPNIERHCLMASWELVLAMGGGSWIHHPIVPARHGGSSRYAQCDLVHFFEIFSLELEQDYVNALGTKGPKANPLPAMTTHRIMNTLMGHIHNLMDAESIDMFQMIVLRTNLDMLDMAGRECAALTGRDFYPQGLASFLYIAVHSVALVVPTWIATFLISLPLWKAIVFSILAALPSAVILKTFRELQSMIDPVRHCFNTFSWTLGLAREIDGLTSEYGLRGNGPLRCHAWEGFYQHRRKYPGGVIPPGGLDLGPNRELLARGSEEKWWDEEWAAARPRKLF